MTTDALKSLTSDELSFLVTVVTRAADERSTIGALLLNQLRNEERRRV